MQDARVDIALLNTVDGRKIVLALMNYGALSHTGTSESRQVFQCHSKHEGQ